jgi:hypothetical protein
MNAGGYLGTAIERAEALVTEIRRAVS